MSDRARDRDYAKVIRALALSTAAAVKAMEHDHWCQDNAPDNHKDELDDLLNNVGLHVEDARGLVKNLRSKR